MRFIYKFKIYENFAVNDNKELYQLEHFKNKRVYPFRKLTYNKDRKAYRIYSQWVSKKRLYKFIEPCDITVILEMSDLEVIMYNLSKSNK